MVDRRITPEERQHDALKQVAGLLTKLSYRDMNKLSDMLAASLPYTVTEHDGPAVAKTLITTAEELLGN